MAHSIWPKVWGRFTVARINISMVLQWEMGFIECFNVQRIRRCEFEVRLWHSIGWSSSCFPSSNGNNWGETYESVLSLLDDKSRPPCATPMQLLDAGQRSICEKTKTTRHFPAGTFIAFFRRNNLLENCRWDYAMRDYLHKTLTAIMTIWLYEKWQDERKKCKKFVT